MPELPGTPNLPPADRELSLRSAVRFLWPSRAAQDFAWFSTLGWPNVKGRPYVRIVDKDPDVRKKQLLAQTYPRGFLLHESADSSTILLTDLRVIQFSRRRPDDSRVLEPTDLLSDAQAYLASLSHSTTRQPGESADQLGRRVPQAVECFVLAWACAQQGHMHLARRLYQQAQAMRVGHVDEKSVLKRLMGAVGRRIGVLRRRQTLRRKLERHLSTAWMWQTLFDFQFPSVSLPNLLHRFEALVRNFPRSVHVADAQNYAVTVKQMLRQDEEHTRTVKPMDQLPPAEQLKELIFQLRYQNGSPREQGGSDIFADPRGEASPAHQLLRLGFEAVPELIRHFESTTLTRTIRYDRTPSQLPRVLTVGDCAVATVEAMFGRSLGSPGSPGKHPRDVATAWWQEAQQKGMTQVLLEGVEQGKEGSVRQAEILLGTDPAALADALPKGFENAMEPWVKRDLVEIAARIPNDTIIPFLQRRLQSRHLQWAVMAAWGLHQRGNPAAVSVMIQRWGYELSDQPEYAEGLDSLIQFLVASADESAIGALAANLRQRPPAVRLKVIETLSDGALPFWLDRKYPGLWSAQMKEKLSPRTFEIIEQLLVSCLDDTAGENWTITGPNGQSVHNPRVCDYAGKLLAEQWPAKYSFEFFASQAERDRQRLKCMETGKASIL